MSVIEQLRPFLYAESIAVIGVSRKIGPGAFNVVESMIQFGYKGKIYPVNPAADEICGIKAYKSIKEVPERVDHALIVIPRHIVPQVVQDCVDLKIPAITIASQGFAELGGEGKELQDKLVEIIKGTETRIIGPNTLGITNYAEKFTTSFIPFKPRDYQPIGAISQTGLWSASFPELKYCKTVDVGNACDVDHVDIMRYYIEDPDIKQIFIHMEGLRPGRGKEFMQAIKDARAKGKSVIVFKAGESKAGARYAISHVGSLAGEDRVFDGALKQAGAIRVRDYREAEVASKILLKLPEMRGKRIGMVTHHGASGTMTIDACDEFGIEMAKLLEENIKPIQDVSPSWLPISNPVDIWPAHMKDSLGTHRVAIESVLRDPGVDGLLVSVHLSDVTPWPTRAYGYIQALEEIAPKYSKPTIVIPVGTSQEETRKELEKIPNVTTLNTIREAIWAFSMLYQYYRSGQRLAE